MSEDIFDTSRPAEGGSYHSGVLPTGTYQARITYAERVPDDYGRPDPNGQKPMDVLISWELTGLTPEQRATGIDPATRVYQRLDPFYGFTRTREPSRWMVFVDTLKRQGLINDHFRLNDLVGIEQLIAVEEYTKSRGPYAGQPGNRVREVRPLNVDSDTRTDLDANAQRPF